MRDCVYDEVPLSKLYISLRVTPRVDFEPLSDGDALSSVSKCTGPTDQLPLAVPDYFADLTITQSCFSNTVEVHPSVVKRFCV